MAFHSVGDILDWPNANGILDIQVCCSPSRLFHQVGGGQTLDYNIDLIGPIPSARPMFKYVVVAVDYFTKWTEAKPLTTISNKRSKTLYGSPLSVSLEYDTRSFQTMGHSSIARNFLHSVISLGSRKVSLQLILTIPRPTTK